MSSVPGDPSSAAFLIVAALLVPGSRLTIAGVGLNPLRTGLLTTLRGDGRRYCGGEPPRRRAASRSAIWSCRTATLRGVDVPPERAPTMIDEYPVLAVAAACAAGTTRMRGLKELRVKESDRLAATAALLAVNGARVEIEGDDLIVHGDGRAACRAAALVETAHGPPHRDGGSVLGPGDRAAVTVDEAAFIDTSFPGFADVDERRRRSAGRRA